jgi:hypothetical protein
MTTRPRCARSRAIAGCVPVTRRRFDGNQAAGGILVGKGRRAISRSSELSLSLRCSAYPSVISSVGSSSDAKGFFRNNMPAQRRARPATISTIPAISVVDVATG